jgi:16S rRNA (guanine966-N2)-methyltransferase
MQLAATGAAGEAPAMRIITGSAGGIPIAVPRTVLRPTADRVREAVFSILGPRIEGAAVLDLFAGSGSYGLESLSRGAASAHFVEQDRAGTQVISQNLAKARLTGGKVTTASVEAWLRRAEGQRFDFIFADPPYAKQRGDKDWNGLLLGSAELSRLLAPGGLFLLESYARTGAPALPENSPWLLTGERRYGDCMVLFFEQRTGEPGASAAAD